MGVRMAVELGTAYVSILPSTKGFPAAMRDLLGKSIPKQGDQAGQTLGQRMSSTASKWLKRGIAAGGVAAGAAAGVALASGFKNAVARQNSQKVLTGLYGSAKDATAVMKDLRNVSKSSPLDYESYLKAAESLAYAGVEGKDATGTLKNVGKAIVAAGGDSTKLDQAMGGVMKAVNNGGIAMMDSLSMISESGVPILSGLSEKFGKPIDQIKKMASEGKINITDVMDVMQNGTGETFQKMMKAGDAASQSFGNQWKIAKDNVVNAVGDSMLPLLEKMAPMIKPIADALVKGIEKLPAILSTVVGLFKEWWPILATVVGGIAAYSLTLKAIAIGQAIWNGLLIAQKFATAGATVQMRLLNMAMKANPIGLIITAVTLLVAGFILMYKKVGWFRDGVNAAWAGIKVAVSAVVEWFKTVVWPALQVAFKAIGDVAVWLWQNAIVPAFNAIRTAIGAVVGWFQTYVWPAIKAVFSAIGAVFTWLWKNIAVPVFNGIKLIVTLWWTGVKIIFNAVIAFVKNYLAPVFQLFWAIIKVVWNGIKIAINAAWQFIKKYIFTPIVNFVNNQLVPRFKFLQAVLKLVWAKIQYYIQVAWAFIKKNIFQPIVNWINTHIAPRFKFLQDTVKNVWAKIKSSISTVWNFIRDKVFNPLKSAITKAVPDAFEKGKDAIGKAWDKVRDIAKKPVKFMISTVINSGIIKNFNKIASKFGVDKMPYVKLPKGFATGGYTGSGGKYTPAGVVHADEYVLRKEAQNKISRTHGRGFLDHMNRTGNVPGYAKGGKVKGGSLWDAAQWWIGKGARASRHSWFNGGKRITSGHSRNSYHYKDLAVDFNYGRGGKHAAEQAFFDKWIGSFQKQFPGIRTIWRAKGHHDHLHIDTAKGANMGAGSVGSGDGGGFDILEPLLAPFRAIKDKIAAGVGKTGFGELIGAGAKKLVDAPIQWVKDNIAKVSEFVGDVTEHVKGGITKGKAFAKGQSWATNRGLSFGQRSNMNWIVSKESGWDPKAQNPRSTASGLPQFINSTSRAYLGGAPAKKYGVYDQLDGMQRYVNDRYNGWGGAVRFWKSHNYYAKGTLSAARGWATVGENGPELLKLRGGEQIKSNRNSRRFIESQSDSDRVVLNVDFHGRVDDPNEMINKLNFFVERKFGSGKYARG